MRPAESAGLFCNHTVVSRIVELMGDDSQDRWESRDEYYPRDL